MQKMDLILASKSPRRKELLEQVGLTFQCIPARGEEVNDANLSPGELVEALSRQKALEVAESQEEQLHTKECIVIGADTVVAYQERILGKPKDEKEAEEMLLLLQGKNHQVYTGVTLIGLKSGHRKTFHVCTQVFVHEMDLEEITAYIDTKEPMDKAGAYGIQGRFAAYVERIEGDYNNVVGLPVSRLCQELKNW